MSQPPDDDPHRPLLEKIRSGKDRDQAFSEAYRLFYPKLIRFFQRWRVAESDCPDLTQEVLFRVFKNIDTFREDSTFAGWVFAIAVHQLKNDHRRRHTKKRNEDVEVSLDPERESKLPEGQTGDDLFGTSVLGKLIAQEQFEDLRAAYMRLPPKERQCFYLRYVREYKYEEIAVLMKISVGTVKAHLFQCRKKLKQWLGEVSGDTRGDL